MTDAEKPLELRPVVLWFAQQMELKLRENDHKGGWHGDDPHSLCHGVIGEADELIAAADDAVIADDESLSGAGDYYRAAVAEAADVAAMAMMVADHFRENGPSVDQGRTL